jgi:serine phosphatase RsbU (regulator of sigma subunit)
MRHLLIVTVFVFSFFRAFSGNTEDSLRAIIKNESNDSLKTMAYSALSYVLIAEPGKVLELLKEMEVMSDKIKSQKIKALCLRKIGVAYGNLNYFNKALEFTFRSAEIFEKLNDKEGLANCYNNIGSYYNNKGEFTKDVLFYKRSIEYHLKAIDIRLAINDTAQTCNSYNNIGNTYMSIEDYEKALEFFNKASEIYSRYKDFNSIEMINSNLGDCYLRMALKSKNKAYLKQSLYYFLNVLKNYNGTNQSDRYAGSFMSVGRIYAAMGNNSLGITYLEKAIAMSKSIHDKNTTKSAAEQLAAAHEANGEYKKALEYFHLYNMYKDSLLNEKSSDNIEQMQALYQTSQKDREIEKLNNEKRIKDAELSRQRTTIISSIGAGLFVLILVLVLLSRSALKKKAHKQLGAAYKKIEIKNQQITDSINYSKRIQNAILPPIDLVSKSLNNFFIYYSPKDIVSGDFYWFSENSNKLFFIVVDCTGHGVPGALMSMIGNTLLNEIINQKDVLEPGEILNQLNKGVKHSLRQSGSDFVSQDDGMDVSVCCIDKKDPSVLKYACANHSVFVKSNNKVVELTGDIYSIGGDFVNTEKSFENKTHKLEPNSFVVMSTDGYYDQFGGAKDSKYLISRFEELILNTNLENSNTAEVFEKEIVKWKGSQKQTDDILIAGFKV